jgi:hypothetical protein
VPRAPGPYESPGVVAVPTSEESMQVFIHGLGNVIELATASTVPNHRTNATERKGRHPSHAPVCGLVASTRSTSLLVGIAGACYMRHSLAPGFELVCGMKGGYRAPPYFGTQPHPTLHGPPPANVARVRAHGVDGASVGRRRGGAAGTAGGGRGRRRLRRAPRRARKGQHAGRRWRRRW